MVGEPLPEISSPGPLPERTEDGFSGVVVFIEAMTDEQAALLVEDLVDVLMRRARRHRPAVASEPP